MFVDDLFDKKTLTEAQGGGSPWHSEPEQQQMDADRRGRLGRERNAGLDEPDDAASGPAQTGNGVYEYTVPAGQESTAQELGLQQHRGHWVSRIPIQRANFQFGRPQFHEIPSQGVAEAATPASTSKVLRLIQRHHSDWFDTYGIGEVEDAVVDMAEMGQFQGMSAEDAVALVAQELDSLYGAQGMAEGSSFPGAFSNRDVESIRKLQRSNRDQSSTPTAPHQRSDWFDPASSVSAKKQKLAYLKSKKQQDVAEGSKEKTPGVALSKAYKKDFDGNKPGHTKPETALTGTYSKTGKPGGDLKKQGVAEGSEDLASLRAKANEISNRIDAIVKDGGRVGFNDPLSRQLKAIRSKIQQAKKQGVAEDVTKKLSGATPAPAPNPYLKDILMRHIDEVRHFVQTGYIDPTRPLFQELYEYFANEIPDSVRRSPWRLERRIGDMIAPYAKFYASTQNMNEQGVAEGYQFKGPFPFDVDHMHGGRGINLPKAETKKYFTDKKQWQRAVDDINSSKYDDNSDYIGVTGRSTVEINGREWARWSDAQQKGYIELSSMAEQGMAEGDISGLGYDAQSLIMKLRRDVEEKRLQPTPQAILAAARELAGDMEFAPQLLVKQVLGQGVAEGYKEERLKGCKCQHRQGDNKKCPIHGVQEGVAEGMLDNPGEQDSPVAQAIIRRILLQRTDLLAKHGPEKVGQAVDEVADFVGDVDEIGSSDVSGWVRHVEQMLGNMTEGKQVNELSFKDIQKSANRFAKGANKFTKNVADTGAAVGNAAGALGGAIKQVGKTAIADPVAATYNATKSGLGKASNVAANTYGDLKKGVQTVGKAGQNVGSDIGAAGTAVGKGIQSVGRGVANVAGGATGALGSVAGGATTGLGRAAARGFNTGVQNVGGDAIDKMQTNIMTPKAADIQKKIDTKQDEIKALQAALAGEQSAATTGGKAGIQTGATALIDPDTNRPYEKDKLAAMYGYKEPAAAAAKTSTAPAAQPQGFSAANVMNLPGMAKTPAKPAAPARTANFAGPGGYGATTTGIRAPAAPSSPVLAAPKLPAAPRVTAGGPTPAEKANLDKRIAAAAPAVAETLRQIDRMLESVNSKKSAEIVRAYVDQRFTALGLRNTTECRNIMAHVVHESAVRRRAYAQRMAK